MVSRCQKDHLKFFPKINGSVKCFSISEREESKKGEAFSLDLYLSSAFDSLVQNLVMFDQDCKKIKGIVTGKEKKREDFGGLLSNLRFARIGGELSTKLGANAGEGKISGSGGVESLNASMAELVELVPQLSDEKKQFSVEDFLKIKQTEGCAETSEGRLTVVVGAVTGGLASVITTSFDVIKTRMMTAPQGLQVKMQIAAITILREGGPLVLFRGVVPRFFWVAPLGAMNFSGYELSRQVMDKTEFLTSNQQNGKTIADKT